MTLPVLLSSRMSFSRRYRQFLCNPVRITLTFCLTVLGVVLYVTYTYQAGEALLRDYLLMPEDINVRVSMCHDNEDATASLCPLATGDYQEERIPRIIHQTYKTADIPENWVAPYKSCIEIHQPSNWTYLLWTDEDSATFIAAKYPWFLDSYNHYPYAIQRADAIRYFIIHHYGGFYLDLDVGCRKDLSHLLKYDAVFPKTAPFGVSNDFMAATRGHPLFQQLISSLKANNRWFGTKYPTVLFSTGPMFVSQEIVKFLGDRNRRKDTNAVDCSDRDTATSVCILHPTLYSTSETSFFAHYRGSTWHGEDVVITKIFWHNKFKTVALLSVLLICVYGLRSLVAYNRSMGVVLSWASGSNRRNT